MPSQINGNTHLKEGAVVRCPPLQGAPGFIGRVTRVDRVVQRDLKGREYRYVTLQPLGPGARMPSTVPSYHLG